MNRVCVFCGSSSRAREHCYMSIVADTPTAVLDAFARREPLAAGKWINPSEI